METKKYSAGEEAPVGVIDSTLRDRLTTNAAGVLVAFDAMLDSATAQNRRALIEATDQLMRVGARIRICLAG
jgi:hypothetical protein